jgi:hypothetical protein
MCSKICRLTIDLVLDYRALKKPRPLRFLKKEMSKYPYITRILLFIDCKVHYKHFIYNVYYLFVNLPSALIAGKERASLTSSCDPSAL